MARFSESINFHSNIYYIDKGLEDKILKFILQPLGCFILFISTIIPFLLKKNELRRIMHGQEIEV